MRARNGTQTYTNRDGELLQGNQRSSNIRTGNLGQVHRDDMRQCTHCETRKGTTNKEVDWRRNMSDGSEQRREIGMNKSYPER